jgi:hypothetical protein
MACSKPYQYNSEGSQKNSRTTHLQRLIKKSSRNDKNSDRFLKLLVRQEQKKQSKFLKEMRRVDYDSDCDMSGGLIETAAKMVDEAVSVADEMLSMDTTVSDDEAIAPLEVSSKYKVTHNGRDISVDISDVEDEDSDW